MPRQQRWQPPHPDPAKSRTPTPANDALGDRLLAQVAAGQPHRCQWNGCPKPRSLSLIVPICDAHAKIVVDDVLKARELQQRAMDEIVTDHQSKVDANTARIEAGERVTEGPVPGWVYYIRVAEHIKIGYARNVSSRMRAYPPAAELLAVEPGTKNTERARHDHFHAFLDRGREWFNPAPELMAWIDELRAVYDPRPFVYEYRKAGPKQTVGGKHWTGTKKTAA